MNNNKEKEKEKRSDKKQSPDSVKLPVLDVFIAMNVVVVVVVSLSCRQLKRQLPASSFIIEFLLRNKTQNMN